MSRKLLDKNFCAIPWSGFIMESDGRVKNCVIAKDIIGNVHKNNIKDILNSTKNIEIKQQMLQGLSPLGGTTQQTIAPMPTTNPYVQAAGTMGTLYSGLGGLMGNK